MRKKDRIRVKIKAIQKNMIIKEPKKTLGAVRLLELDVLKPHDPGVEVFAEEIVGVKGVEGVDISTVEIDARTETLKVRIEGSGIDLLEVSKKIRSLGGTVHSVDRVTAARADTGVD